MIRRPVIVSVAGCTLLALGAVVGSGGASATSVPAAVPATVCEPAQVAIVNGGFEDPSVKTGFPTKLAQTDVPGWFTTGSGGLIEMWPSGYEGYAAAEGKQFVELNANSPDALYQDLPTVPGTVVSYLTFHRGRTDPNTADIEIGAPGQPPNFAREMTDSPDAWGRYVGSYTVPTGQTMTRFSFRAVTGTGSDQSIGNLLDGVQLGTPGCLEVAEGVQDLNGGRVEPGDTLRYTVAISNRGGFAVTSPTLQTDIPAWTNYRPDSVRVLDGPDPGARTDAADGDGTRVADGRIEADVGGPLFGVLLAGQGRHVTFEVTVGAASAGRTISSQSAAAYQHTGLGTVDRSIGNVVVVHVATSPSPTPTSSTPTSSTPTSSTPTSSTPTSSTPTSSDTNPAADRHVGGRSRRRIGVDRHTIGRIDRSRTCRNRCGSRTARSGQVAGRPSAPSQTSVIKLVRVFGRAVS